jgi:polysaccharide export outer membrane protein
MKIVRHKDFSLLCFLFLCALSLMVSPFAYAQQPSGAAFPAAPIPSQAPDAPQVVGPKATSLGIPSSIQQVTPQQADAFRSLTPAQQQAIQSEMGRTGGRLTPDALEALRARPEFRDLSPDEIKKGRDLLEQRDKETQKKEPEKKDIIVEKRTISPDSRPKSPFERARLPGKYQDVSLDLRPFGYEFFREAAVRVVTERRDIPVPLKYVVGPGDEVKILLWGRVNAQYNLVVDRDGRITLPQIGPIPVAGMTFEQMSTHLIKQSEQIVGANIDITMGSLKTIPIFILGDVMRPGAYTIGSFATITDSLLLAGGPSDIGSMRKIQLKRKDTVISTLDLYDLLLKGDKSKDMILQAGDVVFVPVTGPQAGIAGNVKRPAIYELKDHFDLNYLLELAGGIIPTAYTQQIQVERVIKSDRHVVVDVDDKHLDRSREFKLQDADLVKIFSIVDMNVNVVYLNGNVKRPGKYEIKSGMRLKDLIKDQNDLLPETYFDYALIKRMKPPGMETLLIPFNLGSLLFQKNTADNVELKPQDKIYIFNSWYFKDKPFVTIEGEIRGECNIIQALPEDIRKNEELELAGQMKTMEDDLKMQGHYHLTAMIRGIGDELRNYGRIPSGDIRMIQGEMVKVGRTDLADQLRQIESRLKKSCEIALSDNTRVKDVILNAGGLTNQAYLEKGEIVRVNKNREYQTLYFNIGEAMADSPLENLLVQREDRIVIHSVWEQVYRKNVAIDGEIVKPGTYQYTDRMTVRDLVFKGGNIMESAYVDEAEISSIITEGRKNSKTERKVISLRKALEGDPAHNVLLKPNDRLLIKKIPNWGLAKFTAVSGEVRFPGQYTIQKGEKLSSLLDRVGGYTENAYLRGAVFTRQSVRDIQQQGLEEMAKRMERDLLSQGSAAVATALSAEEVKAKEVEMGQKQKFIETLRRLKATGRMTIRLANLRLLKGSEYDIEMEDGDTLHVPQKNKVVNVMGSVMSQASYVYLDEFSYKDYVGMAGGYTRYADPSETFVMKVDGSARKLDRGFMNWNDSKSRWEMSAFGEEIREIEPGDVIVVPEKFDRIAWLREIRDITQILMNTAVVAGVILKLF